MHRSVRLKVYFLIERKVEARVERIYTLGIKVLNISHFHNTIFIFLWFVNLLLAIVVFSATLWIKEAIEKTFFNLY